MSDQELFLKVFDNTEKLLASFAAIEERLKHGAKHFAEIDRQIDALQREKVGKKVVLTTAGAVATIIIIATSIMGIVK
jgi:hypothetical protein